MNAVFADTAYYNALLSPKDALHEKAAEWLDVDDRPIVVTEFVILELANAFRNPKDRALLCEFLPELRSDPTTRIIPASSQLLAAGLKLFAKRLDKEWSLTDCISFVVMEEEGLTDALTADHHFAQAGFTALLT